ncbi:MAG TPA: RIP metalloprotease RseP, partial [Candidatus Obscuribacterales bacterium]
AIVISAGVIANLIFAYFLLVGQVAAVGTPEFSYRPGVVVPKVAAEVSSAAAKAGIKPGDIILRVNNQELGASKQAIQTLMEEIQTHPNEALPITVQRSGETLSLSVTPDLGPEGKGRIGVQLAQNAEVKRRRASNILEAFSTGAREFQRIVVLTVQGFGQLISNFGEMADQVSGPVAIVALGANIARSDAANLFQFAALISINLAIINILPLPALDGGQLAFLLIEGLRGKPLPTKIQDGVMQTGLMLLLGLGIFLIIRDAANLEPVQKLFQP